MAKPRIQVEGLKELRAALKATGNDLDDLKVAGRVAADIVAGEARSLVPVRSGALLATIRPAGQVGNTVVRAGTALVPYAPIIHFGSAARNISPRPFLYDAIDRRQQEVVDAYADQVHKLTQEYPA